MPAERRAQVRRTLAAAGLPVVAVDSSIRLTGDDPGPDLRRFLQLASDCEAPLVPGVRRRPGPASLRARTGSGRGAGPEEAVPLAARLGVRHRRGDARRLLRLLGRGRTAGPAFSGRGASDLVGAVWDSHHLHRMGETPAEVYANLVPASCSPRSRTPAAPEDGDWRLVLLGAGEVPVRRCLSLLAAGGYPHWISVKWEKRWHPEIEDPRGGLSPAPGAC